MLATVGSQLRVLQGEETGGVDAAIRRLVTVLVGRDRNSREDWFNMYEEMRQYKMFRSQVKLVWVVTDMLSSPTCCAYCSSFW
jgi:hypothetical protein